MEKALHILLSLYRKSAFSGEMPPGSVCDHGVSTQDILAWLGLIDPPSSPIHSSFDTIGNFNPAMQDGMSTMPCQCTNSGFLTGFDYSSHSYQLDSFGGVPLDAAASYPSIWMRSAFLNSSFGTEKGFEML
jgi:hypothetical protein